MSRAKKIKKRAEELWEKACKEHPHLKESDGEVHRQNIMQWTHPTTGEVVCETATIVNLGLERLYKNLKWQHKHGHVGPVHEHIALDNAVAWCNAK